MKLVESFKLIKCDTKNQGYFNSFVDGSTIINFVSMRLIKGDHFLFGSVSIKKIIKNELFQKIIKK
jgi:hypothetical protein